MPKLNVRQLRSLVNEAMREANAGPARVDPKAISLLKDYVSKGTRAGMDLDRELDALGVPPDDLGRVEQALTAVLDALTDLAFAIREVERPGTAARSTLHGKGVTLGGKFTAPGSDIDR